MHGGDSYSAPHNGSPSLTGALHQHFVHRNSHLLVRAIWKTRTSSKPTRWKHSIHLAAVTDLHIKEHLKYSEKLYRENW